MIKQRILNWQHKPLLFLIFSYFIFSQSFASSTEHKTQLHLSLAYLSATYSGPVEGEISIPMAINFEYELINSATRSYTFESIIAIDSVDSKTKYYATRFGGRYYFLSSNLNSSSTDNGNQISMSPKWRYYYGWNVGIAQVVVSSLGPVLDAISTVLEYGGHIGTIYQIKKNWGLESKLSYMMGNGFSSITVDSSVMQLYLGGAYYF